MKEPEDDLTDPTRPARRLSAAFVSEVRPYDPPPSCVRCGSEMVPKEYKCLACGNTTGLSDETPAPPISAELEASSELPEGAKS